MTPLCGCDRHRPSLGDLLVVTAATACGLLLFGLAAAVTLVWQATDVDLPDDLDAELAALIEEAS